MPIELIARIAPKNNGDFALLEDIYMQGGFHVVQTLTDRNSITLDRRKYGMRVAVQSNDKVYKLNADLTSWSLDEQATTTLQAAYDAGDGIILTTPASPLTVAGPDNLSDIFIIKNAAGTPILKVSGNDTIEFDGTIRGKNYASTILTNVASNLASVIIDSFDKTLYRACQYCYTITNSDNSGFETGRLYIIHNGITSTVNVFQDNSTGTQCGLVFNTIIYGNNVQLLATTDASSFTRVLNLFRIVLS